jgi:putative chitinase
MSNKFSFNFTVEMTRTLLSGNPEVDQWHASMVEVLPMWEINTVERVAGFIAQCAHESNNFRALEENLSYSADALNRVFPRYFGPAPKRNAAEYARNPEKLANYVYMDEFRSAQGRMGNTQTGDGWRFRGRGLKQLTGRNNYTNFGKTVNMTAEQAAEYVATKKGAIDSACWFWDTAKCNAFADARDIVGLSKRINGGTIGLEDRQRRWNQALQVFGGNFTPTAAATPARPAATASRTATTPAARPATTILRRGSRGPEVQRMQQALKLSADGIFGPGTEAALKSWQRANGLTADGIAGPATLSRLLG